MKRVGDIFPRILDWENFANASWKAARGKRGKPATRMFLDNLHDNLNQLIAEVANGDYRTGPYTRFLIYDPKQRLIHAPCFRDRVLHHAVMNLCEPVFEKRLIFDTYACRLGKGHHAALRRAHGFSRTYPYFLKMDVRHFFDSVNHRVLIAQLWRIFKDRPLLNLFGRIIGDYQSKPGRGLPIGSHCSQHFANSYLAPLDRLVKETLGLKGYVRYMDDFVVWHHDRDVLKLTRDRIVAFMNDALALQPKPSPFINRSALGLQFLGYRLFPGGLRLSKRGARRFAEKSRHYRWLFETGGYTEAQYQQRCQALVAATSLADCISFRKLVLYGSR